MRQDEIVSRQHVRIAAPRLQIIPPVSMRKMKFRLSRGALSLVCRFVKHLQRSWHSIRLTHGPAVGNRSIWFVWFLFIGKCTNAFFIRCRLWFGGWHFFLCV